MLDLVNGLPVHALVVHAVVVLLPLAALGTVVIALVPAARRRYGWLVVALAAVANAAVPLATGSGEALAARVGNPGRHAELGETLPFLAVPLLVLAAAVVVLGARRERDGARGGPGVLGVVVAGLAVVAAVAVTAQTVRIGDSGARAVWEFEVQDGG